MKRLLLLFLFSFGLLHAQSETVDLRSHGKLTIYLSDDWTLSTSDFGDRAIVTIEPKDEKVNAQFQMTVTYPEQDKFPTKAKLKAEVEASAAPMAEQMVEGKAVPKEVNVRTGFGFLCSFTDPKLVGKAPVKGDYKVASMGLVRIAPDVMIEVSIMADSFRTRPYQDLLGALEGMEYEPGRSSRGRGTVFRVLVQPRIVRTIPTSTPTTAGNF